MLILILYFYIFIVALQIIYYLVVFGKFAFAKTPHVTPKKIPISVIVCAKNEAVNVAAFIPLLAEQNYPDFEIVLIDDASSDETLAIFEEFEQQYTNVRLVKVVNNEAFWGNKKYALTLGIKAATKDYLLFTDADCYPTSKDWITAMSSHFTQQKTIVLGYSGYEPINNSFLNKLIRFENLFTAIQYFSWAKIGKPYTGVGRNLAYKKEEFYQHNGFINHIQVRSGGDDLFINEAATAQNIAISFTSESFTYSKAKTSYKDWFMQKRRQVAAASHYKISDKIQLVSFYTSQISFFILSILLLSFQFEWIVVLGLLSVRYLSAWLVVGFSAKKLKEKNLQYWFPIMELVLMFTQMNIFISNLFSKPVNWK
jgi:glycosyltransferase involved in cell wall biosynthesis